MSMGRLCDIFPNSRGPVHEYRFRLVRIIPDPECAEKHTEDIIFTTALDMGNRALDRAINALNLATKPPKKKFMGFPIKKMGQPAKEAGSLKT